jgi:creatinine amidohydrolase
MSGGKYMIKMVMELSWVEIEALNKERTVLFLGFAPIEEHGRHLPVGVDIFETEYWIRKCVERLEKEFENYSFLLLPVIPYGYADLRGFTGNIHLTQGVFYQLVSDTLKAVANWGLRHIVAISGHADPKHLIALEQACETVNKKYGDIAFAPMGAIFSGKVPDQKENAHEPMQDTLKTYPYDYHAGWVETSCILAIKEELVKEDYKKQPDICVKDTEMIFPKRVMKKTAGYGHLGYPRAASKTLGDSLNADMAEKMQYCSAAFIRRQEYEIYKHHELYKIPFLRVRRWGR